MDEEKKEPLSAREAEEKAPTVDAAGKVTFKDEAEIPGFKGFLKGHMPLIKNALLITFLNIVFSLFGLLTLGLQGNMLWLGVLLYLLFLASSVVFIFLIGKTAAYAAFNSYRLNSVNVKNGRHVPKYKRCQEYRPWKGYLTGFLGSLLLIVLVVVDSCLTGDAQSYFGGVVKAMYSLFFTPFAFVTADIHIAVMLIGVVINVVAYGLGYHIFGMKMQLQQEQIEDEIRELHGEFDVDGSDETDV